MISATIPFYNSVDSNSEKVLPSNIDKTDSSQKLQNLQENSTSFRDFNLPPPRFNQKSVEKWRKTTLKGDLNQDGISDQFESKLNSLSEESIEGPKTSDKNISSKKIFLSGSLENENEGLSKNRILIVVQFPKGSCKTASLLFEKLGGTIKATYGTAINGFSGTINYDSLIKFRDILNNQKVPFLIEEDAILEANLYYVSRNMNLRPYVWNTLGYTGDPQSSTAIVDTGIDDSHNFFTPGYSDEDFDYKIVGWEDIVNSYSTPYDDNGHGSHCGGIAAGEGAPALDGLGRSVSTFAWGFDDTGYYWYDDEDFNITAAVFNVTTPGTIEIPCTFDDFTPGIDQVHISPYLYFEGTRVDYHYSSSDSWTHTVSYTATSSYLGTYTLILAVDFDDNDGDEEINDPHMRIRAVLHWPFNPPLYGSGDAWQGVAPDSRLVGVKVLDSYGSGYLSDIVSGIEWVIANKEIYNITTLSMSLGGGEGQTSMIEAVNNAVENGIVTVVAAGNSGGDDDNQIGSPGDADNVITVAAMSIADRVTEYSSSGGLSYTENTLKPDIMAPGGSWINFTVFSTDTNDNDAEGEYTDINPNDMYPAVGTSMATPAVAGATNLLIEVMGGHDNWNYTANEAKLIKALILMTATETYPITREGDEYIEYSPELNRGGKDRQEGYGRINIDAAIEAVTKKLAPKSNISAGLTSSAINSFEKHALGCYVNLNASENYKFILDVPAGADFDLHLYNKSASSIGEPIMLAYSNSSGLGVDESLSFSPSEAGKYYLVAKAISGQGLANISFMTNDVAPTLNGESLYPLSGNQSTLLNFTVIYTDADNIKPNYVNVLLNNTAYAMGQQYPSDTNYADGCKYRLLIYLQSGIYNYTFKAKDGRFTVSTSTYLGLNIAKTNLKSPTLTNGNVTPNVGNLNITLCLFTVNYTDKDNNAPLYMKITLHNKNYTMTKQDSLDFNYMDGCIYIYSRIFNESWYYNFTFFASDGDNNLVYGPLYGPTIYYKSYVFEDDFESGLSKWYLHEGLWHLTDGTSVWPDPYHSPTHSIWFGQESTGTYNTGGITYGALTTEPIDLSDRDEAYLEYYHWREGDGMIDYSFVMISTDWAPFDRINGPGSDWDILYGTTETIDPWEKITIDISEYCGNEEVWIMFYFDTFYEYYPMDDDHRGWLIDDISVSSWFEPNNYAPALTAENLTPTTGNQTTPLNFSVSYTDLDNNAPSSINIVINSTVYPLQKVDASDVTYYNSCRYESIIYLQPGIYNYYFQCSDGTHSNSTKVHTGLIITQTPNLNPPTLSNGKVNPTIGVLGTTTFSFTINYTDVDNNPPTFINVTIDGTVHLMAKHNIYDTDYMDGVIYEYNTSLSVLGRHSFHFNCTDGTYSTSNGPYSSPVVVNDYGLINYIMTPGYSYSWIDAKPDNGGVRCSMAGQDRAAQMFYLPFTFKFYDQYFDSVYVCTNGFASFSYSTDDSPDDLPTWDNYVIAPFWADLEANTTCNIFVRNMTNPNCVIIEWLNIAYDSGPEAGTFELILYDNGDIVFNYLNMSLVDDYSYEYTCGLNLGDDISYDYEDYYTEYTGLHTGLVNFSIIFKYEPVISPPRGDDDDDDSTSGPSTDNTIVIIILIIAFGGIAAVISGVLIKKRKGKMNFYSR